MRSVVLTFLLLGIFSICRAQDNEFDWLNKADKFYSDKNYKKAADAYLHAYQLNPNNETTIYRILYAQNELKDHNAAIDLLLSVPVKIIVDNDGIAEELCFAAKYSDAYTKSIPLLKQAYSQRPEKTNFISALANTYASSKEYGQAISMFNLLAGKTEPDQVDYENWAYSLNELLQYQQALDIGKKGLRFYKEYSPLYVETGYASKKLKKYADAKAYFSKALELDSTQGTAWRYLGEVYKELGDDKEIDQAIRCFNKVISLDQATPGIYYNLGWCYNERDDYELAEDHLKRSIELDTTYSNSYLELGFAQYKRSKYADALVNFNKTIQLDPASELAHYYAGMAYYVQKDQVNLRREYDQLRAMNSDRADKLEKYLK
jgi:tetratricopeptide (TPR) repeat protein